MIRHINLYYKFFYLFWVYLNIFNFNFIYCLYDSSLFRYNLNNIKLLRFQWFFFKIIINEFNLNFSKKILYIFSCSNLLLLLDYLNLDFLLILNSFENYYCIGILNYNYFLNILNLKDLYNFYFLRLNLFSFFINFINIFLQFFYIFLYFFWLFFFYFLKINIFFFFNVIYIKFLQ